MSKRIEVTYEIPGGWYGNDPGSIPSLPNRGNVVINPQRAADAFEWLRKHRFIVLATCIHEEIGNPGLYISYEKMAKRMLVADPLGFHGGDGL